MKNKKTTNMVIFSMLLAIEVVMSFTPLGFLRIGLLSVTCCRSLSLCDLNCSHT